MRWTLVVAVYLITSCGTNDSKSSKSEVKGSLTPATADVPETEDETEKSQPSFELSAGTRPQLASLPSNDIKSEAGSWGMNTLSWDGRLRISCSVNSNIPNLTLGNSYCWGRVAQPLRFAISGDQGIPVYSPTVILTTASGTYSEPPNAQIFHSAVSKDPLFTGPENGPPGQNPYKCFAGGGYSVRGEYECYRIMLVNGIVPSSGERYLTGIQAVAIVHAFGAGGSARIVSPTVSSIKVLSGRKTFRANSGGALRPFFGQWEPSTTADGRLMFMSMRGYTYNNYSGSNFAAFADSWQPRRLVGNLVNEPAWFKTRYPIAQKTLRDASGAPCGDNCGGSYNWISQDATELFFTRGDIKNGDFTGLTPKANFFVVGQRTNYTERLEDGPINANRITAVAFTGSPGLRPGMWGQYPEMNSNFPFPRAKGRDVYPVFSAQGYSEIIFDDSTDGDYQVYLPMNELATGRPQLVSGEAEYMYDTFGWFNVNGSGARTYTPITTENRINHRKTPDTSGNFNTASLLAGASFPTEYNRETGLRPPTETVGIKGRAIYLAPRGMVRIAGTRDPNLNPNSNLPLLNLALQSYTVEIAVKPLSPTAPFNANLNIAKRGGNWVLEVSRSGTLGARLYSKDGVQHVISTSYVVEPNKWHRLALVVRGPSGIATIYANGNQVLRVSEPWIKNLASTTNDILIGAGISGNTSNAGLFLVDEFALSKIARSDEYIYERSGRLANGIGTKTYAQLKDAGATWPLLLTPPLGMPLEQITVPDSVATLILSGETKFTAANDLGRRLFNDTKLTGNNISCASCHSPAKLFADPDSLALSKGVAPARTKRNSPTILNRAFSTLQFADGRAGTLTDQVIAPIVNPDEMRGNIPDLLAYLRNPANNYLSAFTLAFGEAPTKENLSTAIAVFMLGKIRGNSLIDRMEAGQLTADEVTSPSLAAILKGKELFEGKARCSSCHNGPNYTDERFHNNGSAIDADLGRFTITRTSSDYRSFKTPTLRGTRFTAPYFHDGRKANLHDVIVHYNAGGIPQRNLDLEMRPLGLTPAEINLLIAFLGTL